MTDIVLDQSDRSNQRSNLRKKNLVPMDFVTSPIPRSKSAAFRRLAIITLKNLQKTVQLKAKTINSYIYKIRTFLFIHFLHDAIATKYLHIAHLKESCKNRNS